MIPHQWNRCTPHIAAAAGGGMNKYLRSPSAAPTAASRFQEGRLLLTPPWVHTDLLL